ncbi:MAG: hypothetical protein JWO85_3608 [Candidatus Eremiobacteraeota bacterium]|nr:hypothetical protein [Candidatus Eremiobacteraeota bacterium]
MLHSASFGGVTPGGFVPLIAALSRRITARGDTFALVVPQVDRASWYAQVREAGTELHVVAGVRQAAQLAHAWRPDVAHVHFFGWEVPLTVALWGSGARLIWHAHSTSLRNGRVHRTLKTLLKYRLFGAGVERFVAVSNAVREELVAVGAPRDRFVTIPNAVDPARFRPPSARERVAARSALGIGDDRAILFFGRDSYIKGADVLAAALADVSGAVVVAVATPAGTCAELARHARVIAIERVDDVVPLLWACDALAMPSRGEGFPFVLLEAMFAGLPVVASDLPALRETAGERPGVRFAAVGDAPALASALRGMLSTARESTHAARTDGAGTLEHWAASIDALYERR